MGKIKKIGLGFGIIIIGSFFGLIIISQIWMANLTPEERLQLEEKREAEALQKEIDERQAEILKEQIELSKQKQAEREEAEALKEETLKALKNLEEEKLKALKKLEEEAILDTEEEVLEFITNYKGKDNSGLTLYDTMGLIMEVTYPGENILTSPTTTLYVLASRDYSRDVSDKYWKFEINIETYKEEIYLKWIIDTETNSVYPANEESKSVLDILDTDK